MYSKRTITSSLLTCMMLVAGSIPAYAGGREPTPTSTSLLQSVQAPNTQALTLIRLNEYEDYILWSSLECDVKWDQSCSASKLLDAPPGWQVCKVLYTVSNNRGKTELKVEPAEYYTNDPEDPDRFRAYTVAMSAKGNGNRFNRRSANLTLTQVGIRIIPAEYTNQDRYRLGCTLPNVNT